MTQLIPDDPWLSLRAHTNARIALGRAGGSLPTQEVLAFGMAHAQARDAVLRPLDTQALRSRLEDAGYRVLQAHSLAPDRQSYLLRPDKGRQLHPASLRSLQSQAQAPHRSTPLQTGADQSGQDRSDAHNTPSSLAIVIADGLSAVAIERHAVPLLNALRERHATDWDHTPVVIAEQARVALGDPIGEALNAKIVVVLIGERPGLSSPDSLGIYMTWAPCTGRMDSERNCISNVRPEGLDYAAAAHKLAYLLNEATRLQFSGVALKDDSVGSDLTLTNQS
jgi:ethanolamine ammonia-lyase small subunit